MAREDKKWQRKDRVAKHGYRKEGDRQQRKAERKANPEPRPKREDK